LLAEEESPASHKFLAGTANETSVSPTPSPNNKARTSLPAKSSHEDSEAQGAPRTPNGEDDDTHANRNDQQDDGNSSSSGKKACIGSAALPKDAVRDNTPKKTSGQGGSTTTSHVWKVIRRIDNRSAFWDGIQLPSEATHVCTHPSKDGLFCNKPIKVTKAGGASPYWHTANAAGHLQRAHGIVAESTQKKQDSVRKDLERTLGSMDNPEKNPIKANAASGSASKDNSASKVQTKLTPHVGENKKTFFRCLQIRA
jgi:hypothetical protein